MAKGVRLSERGPHGIAIGLSLASVGGFINTIQWLNTNNARSGMDYETCIIQNSQSS